MLACHCGLKVDQGIHADLRQCEQQRATQARKARQGTLAGTAVITAARSGRKERVDTDDTVFRVEELRLASAQADGAYRLG